MALTLREISVIDEWLFFCEGAKEYDSFEALAEAVTQDFELMDGDAIHEYIEEWWYKNPPEHESTLTKGTR